MQKKIMTLLATLGLAVGVHQRGENLSAIVTSPMLQQHVGPELQPQDAVCHKTIDLSSI